MTRFQQVPESLGGILVGADNVSQKYAIPSEKNASN